MGYSNLHSGNNKIVETKCVPEQFCALVKNLFKREEKSNKRNRIWKPCLNSNVFSWRGSYGIGYLIINLNLNRA